MSDNLKALLAAFAVGIVALFLMSYWKRQDQAVVRELRSRGVPATRVWVARVRRTQLDRRTNWYDLSQYKYNVHYTAAPNEFVKSIHPWSVSEQFNSYLGGAPEPGSEDTSASKFAVGFGVVYLPENAQVARVLDRNVIHGDWDWLPGWMLPLAAVIVALPFYVGILKLLSRGLASS